MNICFDIQCDMLFETYYLKRYLTAVVCRLLIKFIHIVLCYYSALYYYYYYATLHSQLYISDYCNIINIKLQLTE